MAVAGGLAVGLWEYRRAQAWKRAEFTAERMQAMLADPRVENVLGMLDYSKLEVELLKGRTTVVDNHLLTQALRLHTEDNKTGRAQFTDVEVAIRDAFDVFLGNLERQGAHVEAGLVTPGDLAPYLRYWLDIMGRRDGSRKPVEFVDALWAYVDGYGYRGVQRLFERFGHDIRPLHARRVPVKPASSPPTPPRVS